MYADKIAKPRDDPHKAVEGKATARQQISSNAAASFEVRLMSAYRARLA